LYARSKGAGILRRGSALVKGERVKRRPSRSGAEEPGGFARRVRGVSPGRVLRCFFQRLPRRALAARPTRHLRHATIGAGVAGRAGAPRL